MVETNRCEHNDATRNGCFDCMRARIKTLENTVGFHKRLSDIRHTGRAEALAKVERLRGAVEFQKTLQDALEFRRGQVVDLEEKVEALEDELIDTRSDVVGADETTAEQSREIKSLTFKLEAANAQLEHLADGGIDRDAEAQAETNALIVRAFHTDLQLAMKKLDALGRENLDLLQRLEISEDNNQVREELIATLRQTCREYQHDNADLLKRLMALRIENARIKLEANPAQ